jgi:hypothetical protein
MSALDSVASSLDHLARDLGVGLVAAAIDDDCLGRQVFSSGRRNLGDLESLCFGAPRVEAEPGVCFAPGEERLLLAAIGLALEHARRPRSPRGTTALDAMRLAAARGRRSGWSSTVVVAVVLERSAAVVVDAIEALHANVRAGEALSVLDDGRIVWVLDGTPSEHVPAALARLVQHVALGRLVFGVAICPSDGTDADELLTLAQSRLDEARLLRAGTAPPTQA